MSELKKFISSSFNLITVFSSVGLSLFFWIFQPLNTIPAYLFIITLCLCFFLLWLFLMSILNNKKENSYDIKVIQSIGTYCLCTPNKILTHDSIVSFYYLDKGFEHLIAYGIVINIQGNDMVQIEPTLIPNIIIKSNSVSITNFIIENRKSIIIKPIVTKPIIKYLGGIYEKNI
ncbi:hypothetical protein [Clostridium sp. UBA5712]|uniref:hypothetical protein n=1 Tax=Clostridium sp. UBA5712 TaxID=1946368 RepID=UPI003216E684